MDPATQRNERLCSMKEKERGKGNDDGNAPLGSVSNEKAWDQ
jgi:hypothetical protein